MKRSTLMITAAGLIAALPQAYAHEGPGGVEIRRTTDGIPHLRADNWRDLGAGVGYVQAQDALCTLAEAFVTYEGKRAWFFGADAQPANESTFGRPKNLELDLFFRAFADDQVLKQYRQQNPAQLNELITGFAQGYNRYLTDARAGKVVATQRTCLNQPWVRPISPDDIYRRMYSAQIAGSYAGFIADIVNSQPSAPVASADNQVSLAERLSHRVGDMPGLGSNAWAFGQQATGEKERRVIW